VSRSAPTERAAPAPAYATAERVLDGTDEFLASCAELGVDPFFMDVICGALGMMDGEQDAKRERAIAKLQAQIGELKNERTKSAEVIDLPNPLRSRRRAS
jgi:hypothetical protein